MGKEALSNDHAMLSEFLSPTPSLKICGITTAADAQKLVALGVHALGLNFWPNSKRYCPPETARTFTTPLSGKILRVGVFVNNSRPLAEDLFSEGVIDVVQLHGDESLKDVQYFLAKDIPVIRAVSALKLPEGDLPATNFALLIDTPAGKDYGGTGQTFDWTIARRFIDAHPGVPVILAGGLTPLNAHDALQAARPVALDVASGAEISPGHKDFDKVSSLLSTLSK
ncbi:phosphoribosylanthranilate isomerase [Verrucomicrobiaceae bacterium 227]